MMHSKSINSSCSLDNCSEYHFTAACVLCALCCCSFQLCLGLFGLLRAGWWGFSVMSVGVELRVRWLRSMPKGSSHVLAEAFLFVRGTVCSIWWCTMLMPFRSCAVVVFGYATCVLWMFVPNVGSQLSPSFSAKWSSELLWVYYYVMFSWWIPSCSSAVLALLCC